MANENNIVFRMGEETGIVIEKTKEQFEKSLFKEQYRQAFEMADEIIRKSQAIKDEKGENFFSNVVAFCGDRGEGKTSALSSVRYILQNEKAFDDATEIGLIAKASNIKKNSCLVLPLVDPSFFDEQHNIVELVIGQMYEKVAQDNKEDKKGELANGGYRKLMEKFADAKNCLSAMDKKDDLYDAISELSVLAAGVRLRASIGELFREFLNYYKKEILIIGIDDIDLNMEKAYEMAENIRKYLFNKHCIVLLAVKIEQLQNAIHTAIRKSVEVNVVSDTQITEMAQKYITKFIPENHRVIMPSPDDIMDYVMEIYDRDGEKMSGVNDLPVRETIVRLIFNKTRYLFYNNRSVSLIVPHNLREINQLVGLLEEMPVIFYDNDTRLEKNLLSNKTIFKNYFFHSWIHNNLATEDKAFAKELSSYSDLISVNKYVVAYLAKFLLDDTQTYKSRKIDDLYEEIITPENRSHNISIGDVYYVIKQIETITTDLRMTRLLFFVRAYYSMKLYEIYDSITTGESLMQMVNRDKAESTKVRIYKYDTLYNGTNQLQRFLNGSYFTYKPGTMLVNMALSGVSNFVNRDIRPIYGKELAKLIKACNATQSENNFVNLENHLKKASPKSPSESMLSVWRCEYFILCTTMQLPTPLRDVKIDRKAIDPPFIGEYENIERKYLYFDFLSLFYNLTNINYAFERFGEEGKKFRDLVLKLDWSLTSLMMKVSKYAFENKIDEEQAETDEKKSDKENVYDKIFPNHLSLDEFIAAVPLINSEHDDAVSRYHRLLSDACIRVSEVQQSIVDTLNTNRVINKHRDDKSNTKKLRAAYQDIQGAGITLPALSDKEDSTSYQLRFNFLTPIIYYLHKENEDEFNNIYYGSTLTEEQMSEFYKYFPKALNSGALQKYKIIAMLTSSNNKIPGKNDSIWDTILTKEKYTSKDEWLKECLEHTDILYK